MSLEAIKVYLPIVELTYIVLFNRLYNPVTVIDEHQLFKPGHFSTVKSVVFIQPAPITVLSNGLGQ